jgi:hypothetical protein
MNTEVQEQVQTKMKVNPRSQAWMITMNYKNDEVWEDNRLSLHLQQLQNIQWFMFQLEKSEKGYIHHQCYVYFSKRVYFSTIKEHLPKSAHIEMRLGLHKQAKVYVSKEDTRLNPTQTWGDEPQQGERTDLADIIDMIQQGYTINEIVSAHPSSYIRYQNNIEKFYQKHKADESSEKFRKLEVVYLYGKTGVGKTSTIMKHYGFNNVYRITDYKNPFDTYNGQNIIIFDEFHSQIKIEFMLNLLDGYPLKLPARYNDKTALYEKVYIISNEPLEKQYKNIQADYIDTFQALQRRIHYIFDSIDKLKIHLTSPF